MNALPAIRTGSPLPSCTPGVVAAVIVTGVTATGAARVVNSNVTRSKLPSATAVTRLSTWNPPVSERVVCVQFSARARADGGGGEGGMPGVADGVTGAKVVKVG